VLPLGKMSDRVILPPSRLENVTRNRDGGVVVTFALIERNYVTTLS
jgi:hypothetical protein